MSLAVRSPLKRSLLQSPKPTLQFFQTRSLTITPRALYQLQPGDPKGPNEPPTHTNAAPSKSPLKVWPFVLIFATGTFLFKAIIDQRKGQYQAKGPVSGHSPSRP